MEESQQPKNIIWRLQLLVTVYLTGMTSIYNLQKKMMQETKVLHQPYLIVMGHLLLLLQYGTSLLPFTLKLIEYMYIHNTTSDLRQMIQNDSVTEIAKTQPNMTFLKNILQRYLIEETGFTMLLVMKKYYTKDCDTQKFITWNHHPYVY